jgi:hypothetical protein
LNTMPLQEACKLRPTRQVYTVLNPFDLCCVAAPLLLLFRDWDSESDREGFGPNRRGSRANGRRGGCNGRSESELMLLDPKRVKRILANRESAARSKVRPWYGCACCAWVRACTALEIVYCTNASTHQAGALQ